MRKTGHLTQAAAIAALYVILTLLSSVLGLASGAVQLRLSEALTVLPLVTPAAVPGLFVGCLLSNLITGCAAVDTAVGSLATLLGALGTCYFGRKRPRLSPLFPVAANTIAIPPVLRYVYGLKGSLPVLALGVFAGECAACWGLGLLLYKALKSKL